MNEIVFCCFLLCICILVFKSRLQTCMSVRTKRKKKKINKIIEQVTEKLCRCRCTVVYIYSFLITLLPSSISKLTRNALTTLTQCRTKLELFVFLTISCVYNTYVLMYISTFVCMYVCIGRKIINKKNNLKNINLF